jgi:hypothetical protein
MRRWLWGLALVLGAAAGVRADDVLARERFEQGVRAASDGRWLEAKQHLEASLRESDKPATRYNLIVANQQLGSPLELVRHALAFLAAPPSAAQAELGASVQELLDAATPALAVVLIDALPADAQLLIDGAAPALLHEGRIYLAPGLHRFELRRANASVETAEADVTAGQTAQWPRAPPPAALPAAPAEDGPKAALPAAPVEDGPKAARTVPPVAPEPPPFRTRTSVRALAIAGAISGVTAIALYVAAEHRGRPLPDSDLESAGYARSAERYSRLKYTIMPFAFLSGALLASAVVADTMRARRGSMAWAVASLVLGGALLVTGGVLLALNPAPLVDGTGLETLSRERGSLLLSASFPLIGYGVTFSIGRK